MKSVTQDLADQLGRALNKLRGHQTESEPTLIALVYLRLLDIKSHLEVDPTYPRTKNTQGVTIPSELRWQQIVNSDYPGELALRAIKFIDSLYGDLFSGLINREAIAQLSRNPQLGRQLVEIVQELKLDQTAGSELPALADELTTLLFTYQGVQGGEFYTPTDLTALVIQLANPRPSDSVYDPACGTGGLLTAAYNHATQTGSPLRTGAIVGSDVNTHVASIARLNALLHGLPVSSIETADSLAGLSNGDESQRFDIILTDLPVGLRYNDTALQRLEHAAALQFKYGPATRIADFNFIQHSLSRLNDTGRAVILTSLRVLFVSGRESIVRKALIDSDVIESIITLPSHILPYTGAQPAILVFNKSKPADRQRKVLFIHADEEFEQGTRLRRTLGNLNQQRILDAFRSGSSEMRFSASVTNDAIAARDYVLIPSSYVGFDDIQVFLGADVEHIELNELGAVLKGMRLAHQKDGTAPILQGRDLSVPFLTVDDLSKRELPQIIPSVSTSRLGDILIQRIGQTPRALLVEEHLVGIPISDTVYIIRPEQDDRLRARYLVEFLNSSVGQAKLSTCLSGSVIPTLGLSKLRNLRIPIPHRSVMEIIRDLQDVERTLTQRAHKSRLLRSQLFGIESEDVFNQRLQDLTVESQVLKQSIVQAEDLDFQMRNYFPHVISYSYRFLDAIQNEAQLYKEQLRVAENFLAFLGSVGLALVVESRSTQGTESRGLTYQMLCEFWQGGISPGHWQEMAVRSATLLRGANEEHSAITNFCNLWFKGKSLKQSQFAKMMQDLVGRKNDFKHDRGPQTPYEYSEATHGLNQKLRECLRELAFLVQHPMRLVQDFDIDWKTRQTVLSTLVYVGDHPGLRQENILVSNPLPKDKLYLELRLGQLSALYPLISAQYCASCKARETYFVDRWERSNGSTVLKSFERGHTHANDETSRRVGADIDHWLRTVFPPQSPGDASSAPTSLA